MSKNLFLIFFLGLIIRLVILYIFRNASNFDIESYRIVGKLILDNTNIYPDIARLHHPYLPFYLYIEAAAIFLSQFNIEPIIFLKTINIVFDMGVLLLVYKLSNENTKKTLLYAINPVTILISTLHGQFDAIPIFLILLSFYLIKLKKELLSVFIFSTAILTKTWPILLIFQIFHFLKNKYLIGILIIMPIISVILYSFLFKINPFEIIKTNFTYHGLFGIWGITYFFSFFELNLIFQKLVSLFLITIVFLYGYIYKERDIVKGSYIFLLFFFSFTPGFSIQYFSWILPFLILYQPRNWKVIHLLLIITVCLNYIIFLDPKIIFIKNIFAVSILLTWISILNSWWNNEKKILPYRSP